MAKKATKKQIKKTVKATKSVSSKLNTSSVKEEVKSSVKKVKGNAGAAIEKLSNEGNAQASHIWKHIKSSICNYKGRACFIDCHVPDMT